MMKIKVYLREKIVDKKILHLYRIFRFLISTTLRKIDGSAKKYPIVIQLPITYRCNSRCVMCNIWKMDNSNEITLHEFSKFLKDPIFKKVKAVGINGGEPSLIPNLYEYAKEILCLPKIKSLNIISNGFNNTIFLKNLERIYKECQKKGILFHVSISLDGFGKIHNNIRGIPKAFERTVSTIDKIIYNKSKYCDSLDIGCTVVKQNIYHLIELDMFAKLKNYNNIKYRLGVSNKRIESNKIIDNYSVIYDTFLKQTAKEFFYSRFLIAKDIIEKFKYFSIFYWLNKKTPKRLLGCMWKEEGITMDSRGNLYYCAVASKKIGSLRNGKGEEIFFDDKNIKYRMNIIKEYCDKCIHDYNGKLEFRNVIIFFKTVLFNKIWVKIYRLKLIFL